MITIGVNYGGPEQKGSGVYRQLNAAMSAISDARGPWVGGDDFEPGEPRPVTGPFFEVGSAPALNVIFYVPGSLLSYSDLKKIEAARFSRTKKLLLVAVPVPRDVVQAGGSVGFVIDALRQAVAVAAEVFARKNVGVFDQARAEAIIQKVQEALATRRGD
jgi:hypothetical protein